MHLGWINRRNVATAANLKNPGLTKSRRPLITWFSALVGLENNWARRPKIEDTLNGAKHKRYRYAAKHLAECAASDAVIADYGNFPTHEQFLGALKADHGRKQGFWGLMGK